MIASVTSPAFPQRPAPASAPPTDTKTTQSRGPVSKRAGDGAAAAPKEPAHRSHANGEPARGLSTIARPPDQKDGPTGPPPAFEESPLERQARIALDSKEIRIETASGTDPSRIEKVAETDLREAQIEAWADTPERPRERAEVSFSETRASITPRGTPRLDISR